MTGSHKDTVRLDKVRGPGGHQPGEEHLPRGEHTCWEAGEAREQWKDKCQRTSEHVSLAKYRSSLPCKPVGEAAHMGACGEQLTWEL